MLDIIYHYPPELFQLLIDTIPLLSRSKKDVLIFFRGAGVPHSLVEDLKGDVGSKATYENIDLLYSECYIVF